MSREVDTHMRQCEECGAIVYPEHLQAELAGYWHGKLLCKFCLAEHRGSPADAVAAASVAAIGAEPPAASGAAPDRIKFGGTLGPGGEKVRQFRRPLLAGSPCATRCKTFHGKLTDAAIAYLNEQINEWADSHDDVEIKFAQTTVGIVEGKHSEPHLIITVFY
ncbi:MAG: hypothetical protein HRF50_07765 [Phycisphaerae bacterium]